MTMPKQCLKALLILASLALVVVALLFSFRVPLLKAAARSWIVDTSPTETVDAVLIPGGGLETRPFGAAKLYHENHSIQLVTFEVEQFPTEKLGITRPHHELTLEVLTQLDVPAESIIVIGDGVTSTQDEVIASRKWAIENEVASLAVMTEIFPSRRVAWAYEKGFADTDIAIHVVPLPSEKYTADTWWQDETGLIQFQNEVIKFFYYLIRY